MQCVNIAKFQWIRRWIRRRRQLYKGPVNYLQMQCVNIVKFLWIKKGFVTAEIAYLYQLFKHSSIFAQYVCSISLRCY